MEEHLKTLKAAFSTMTEQEKDNVRYHLERETPILCGAYAYSFAHEGGL